MLLWSFRDDSSVVKFMAQFVSKVDDISPPLIGIFALTEAYLI